MITKIQLLIELINFSSFDKPISSRDLFNKYRQPNETLIDYHRKVALLVRELQDDQIIQSGLNQPKKLVFSFSNGYYLTQNREEALGGLEYYIKPGKQIMERGGELLKLIDRTYPEPEQQALFQ